MDSIIFLPIGMIHSPFTEPAGTPIQPAAGKDIRGTVEVYSEFEEGLQDLSGFSHIILLYHLHRSGKPSMKVKPFLDQETRGVFSTRAPSRPNAIGLSVVRLLSIDGRHLRVAGMDILDGTPLLDIKPYVPGFDDPADDVRTGWLESRIGGIDATKDDGRFLK
jgi:tRNA (adenine37-N6)-methyltransferase